MRKKSGGSRGRERNEREKKKKVKGFNCNFLILSDRTFWTEVSLLIFFHFIVIFYIFPTLYENGSFVPHILVIHLNWLEKIKRPVRKSRENMSYIYYYANTIRVRSENLFPISSQATPYKSPEPSPKHLFESGLF